MTSYLPQAVSQASGAATPATGRSVPIGATLDGKHHWRRWIDTALDPPHDICEWNAEPSVSGTTYRAGARSVVVLIAGNGHKPSGVDA